MVTSVILIRHAQSEKEKKDLENSNLELLELDKNRVLQTSSFLEVDNFSIVYSSDMPRAIKTAKLISQESVIQKELSEFNKIVFEEQPDDIDKFNENIEKALKTKDFFEEILRTHRDSKILICTHENVIRFLLCQFLKLKHYKAPNFFIDNASITHLFFEGNELISVGCINSTQHLYINER